MAEVPRYNYSCDQKVYPMHGTLRGSSSLRLAGYEFLKVLQRLYARSPFGLPGCISISSWSKLCFAIARASSVYSSAASFSRSNTLLVVTFASRYPG